ncbi:MAG: asparagine synthase (glutamine-hydrolyzing) [Clostridia bacterium]|nr:asparagine synthase (glutamine-hydrolyzing) [Clostridia bacterium]
MCSICGIVDFKNTADNTELINKMNSTMKHRGPDESDIFVDRRVAFGHNRLSVIDLKNGHQPMSVVYGNKRYTIVYNGEVYNCAEIKKELSKRNIFTLTTSDTEVVLYSYIAFGEDCVHRLNGIFAFCVYDGERVFAARDRFGVKPFYYSVTDTALIFASEIKAMLAHPKVSSTVDRYGLWELLYLSPNFIGGKSVFKDICELLPGEYLVFDEKGLKKRKYWQIKAIPYFKDKGYAIDVTRYLVSDAVKRQLVSDVPLCVLLSGGLDSSVVTAIASDEYKKKNMTLDTYSFEYEGNKSCFENSLFQPEKDDDYATFLADYLGTNHRVLTIPTLSLADSLKEATLYRDLPGQADIDSSLYYFCKEIKKNNTVGLSGECSDEIFGGYPWFYRPEMLYSDFFPWIHKPRLRPSLFKDETSNSDTGYDYIREIYKKTLDECPVLKDDSDEMKASRRASYLSVNYFMTSLLQRKDRMSMASGVEIRVPFADHRIFEFVFNVPWEIKFENGVEKSLLRRSMEDILPEKILWRKKSPYPKTHNPQYLKEVISLLDKSLAEGGYLSEHLDRKKLDDIITSGGTWFGQLMDTPQLIAWLVQFDYWSKQYNINFIN